MKLYIAYAYESALGRQIYKLVECANEQEYKRVKDKIESAGLEPIEFVQVWKGKNIPN